MAASDIAETHIFEDGDATILSRNEVNGLTTGLQTSTASVTWKVFDLSSDTPDTAVGTGTLVVADVLWDALQTDDRWGEDSTGYNFRHRLVASNFATGDHWYRVEYRFTGVGGEIYWLVRRLWAQRVYTS